MLVTFFRCCYLPTMSAFVLGSGIRNNNESHATFSLNEIYPFFIGMWVHIAIDLYNH